MNKTGPKRDVVGELATAFQDVDVQFGLYHSLFEWFNPMWLADKEANFTTQTFVDNKIWPEMVELINKYNPQVIFLYIYLSIYIYIYLSILQNYQNIC